MKAITHDRYGDADVLRVEELPIPEITPDQVLIRVHAAGVDRGVWHLMTGTPKMVRPVIGMNGPRQRTIGLDVAGIVDKVGSNVTQLTVGDRVFGVATGSFAEFAKAKPKHLARIPDTMSFEQAAALPASGQTALQALRAVAPVAGRRLMIIGAGSGVGTFAIQLAKAQGAHVTAVCSTGKIDLVRDLGADEVVDYTVNDLGSGIHDVIFDIAGIRAVRALRERLAPKGTVVFIGGEGGGPLMNGMQRQIVPSLTGGFTGNRFITLAATTNTADLEELARLFEAGSVVPVVHQRFPLERAAEALHYIGEGHATGKTVITVR